MNQDSPPSIRHEYLAMGFLTLAGGLIRFYGIQNIGLSHFDAGIYAQSALWPWTGEWYPGQGYYSPPLFPFLWGLFNFILGSPTDWGGVFISALAGTALVPATWYLGRQWFGPGGGLTGATLIAFDAMNILFSRIALTDSLFTFLFISTLGVGYGWMLGGGWWRGAAALTISTLCVYTKYNGFMPLYFLLILSCFQKPKIACISRSLLLLVSTLVTYLPWISWFHVQHGYASLWEHQSGYLSDWTDVPNNYLTLMGEWGLTSGQSLPVTLLLVTATIFLFSRKLAPLLIALPAAVVGSMVGWFLIQFPLILGLWGITRAKVSLSVSRWMIALLLILAPAIYAPYFRLWLPTSAFFLAMAGGGLVTLPEREWSEPPYGGWIQWVLAVAIVLAGTFTMIRSEHTERWSFLLDIGYRPHAGCRESAHQVFKGVDGKHTVFTLARPPLPYYLEIEGVRVQRLDGKTFSLSSMRSDDWLLVDRVLEDNPNFQDIFLDAQRELRTEGNPLLDVDLITLLDAYHGHNPYADLSAQRLKERLFVFRKK